jgi:hypothetical protein
VWAEAFRGPPQFVAKARSHPARGRRRAGEIYERQAHEVLQARSEYYTPAPWIAFKSELSGPRVRFCQPDGLLLDFKHGKLILIEIKLLHSQRAWWQTRQLYEPVLRKIFTPDIWEYAICEVARYIDPRTEFPEEFDFVSDPTSVQAGRFGVCPFMVR